jgi:hypothetical protein
LFGVLQLVTSNKSKTVNLNSLFIFYVPFVVYDVFLKIATNGKAFVQGGLDSTIAPQSTKPT